VEHTTAHTHTHEHTHTTHTHTHTTHEVVFCTARQQGCIFKRMCTFYADLKGCVRPTQIWKGCVRTTQIKKDTSYANLKGVRCRFKRDAYVLRKFQSGASVLKSSFLRDLRRQRIALHWIGTDASCCFWWRGPYNCINYPILAPTPTRTHTHTRTHIYPLLNTHI